MKNSKIILIISDLLITLLGFGLWQYFANHISLGFFWIMASLLWVVVSVLLGKFDYQRYKKFRYLLIATIITNALVFVILCLSLLLIESSFKFWSIYLVIPVGITLLECGLYSLYQLFFIKHVNYLEEDVIRQYVDIQTINKESDISTDVNSILQSFVSAMANDFPTDAENWRNVHKDEFGADTVILTTPNTSELDEAKAKGARNLISISNFNDIRYINRYFIHVNEVIPEKGLFIIGGEVSDVRKANIMKSYPVIINKIVYFFDFIWNRLFPKMNFFKKLYFAVTKGKHRVFPRPEIMGRLCSCGFEIKMEQVIANKFFVAVQKVCPPLDIHNPSYGPLIRLRRVGKGGKTIGVYKFRTMHAYSEYLQAYIYDHNNLQEGGKIADDYRVSTVGHFLRKFWLDELPMVLNILKGDLKLVGVRPLSFHYYGLYTPEMQEMHIKVKPGLLPPFYVDMPKTLEDVQESEKRYIQQYLQHPFRTDWKYFWLIMKNIVLKRKRSA